MNEVRAIHISGFERPGHDFFRTPEWVTRALLKHVTLRGPIWEPCCGDGAMARVLIDHGQTVVASDLVDRGYGTGGVDFFNCDLPREGCAAIVTNPPYGERGPMERDMRVSRLAMPRFVEHGLRLAARVNGQLALLVRLQWTAGRGAARLITSGPLDSVVVLTRRIQWFDMGKDTKNGQHHHCWVFWDYQRDPTQPPRIVYSD